MIPEADNLIAGSPVADIVRFVYALLVDGLHCQPYVKTIYIGFEHEGEMVAALYAHAKSVEVALALPEDAESSLLIDATHLTWPTMPVATVLQTLRDARSATPLFDQAFTRVLHGTHDVRRPAEHFGRRQRLGRD